MRTNHPRRPSLRHTATALRRAFRRQAFPGRRGPFRNRPHRATTALALTATVLAALTACSSTDPGQVSGTDAAPASGPRLTAHDGYVPQPVTDAMAGGFVTVKNTGDTADKLISATSDLSDEVQLHRTVERRMRQVKSFTVPAEGELRLSRGGNHLMFLGLQRKPVEGDTVRVKLHFEKSDPLTVDFPVEATNHVPQPHHSPEK